MRQFKIRVGTFETNSSSAHTMILTNTETYVNAEKVLKRYMKSKGVNLKDKEIYFPIKTACNFDDNFEIIFDWDEKLSYLIIYCNYQDKLDILTNMLKKAAKLNIVGIDVLIDQYDYYACRSTESIIGDDLAYIINDYIGTIDSQSVSLITSAIDGMRKLEKYKDMSEEDLYYEIVFSNKIAIVTDGDSSSEVSNLIINSIIDSKKIEGILLSKYEVDPETNEEIETGDFLSVDGYIEIHGSDDV